MKTIFTVIALLICSSVSAQLTIYCESQNIFNYSKGVQSYTPVVKMETVYIPDSSIVGLNVWGEALKEVPFASPRSGQFWGQGLVGVAVAPRLKRLDLLVFNHQRRYRIRGYSCKDAGKRANTEKVF